MNQKLNYYKIDRKNEKKIKESVFFSFRPSENVRLLIEVN